MSESIYPSIPYREGISLAPTQQSLRYRIAPSGKIFAQNLAVFDTRQIDLIHPGGQEVIDELEAHWETNQGNEFLFTDANGRDWMARYLSAPKLQHVQYKFWNVVVSLLLRRLDQ